MQKKVSVIVPVYNVQDYMAECIDSLVKQTYRELEIILIDDGSTDESGLLCDKFAQQDARIQVIHQKNQGAGAAKNSGLDAATGEYLIFADSDDVLPLDSVRNRVNLLERYDADVVQGTYINFQTRVPESENIAFDERKVQLLSKDEIIDSYIDNWENALLWNKIYKTEYVKGIRFPVGHCIDDEFFTYQTLFRVQKMLKADMLVYYYRQRVSSVMNDPSREQKKLLDRFEYIYERYLNIKEFYPKYQKRYLENLVDSYLYLSDTDGFGEIHKKYMKEKIKRLKKEIRQSKIPSNLKVALAKKYYFKL